MSESGRGSWEKASRWYDPLVGNRGHFYHQTVILPYLEKHWRESKALRILDLGCGQGVLAASIPAQSEYWGVDISPALILQAKKRHRGAKYHFLVGDATDPSLNIVHKGEFSEAVCLLSLQNMANPAGCIALAGQALADQSVFHIVLNHPAFRIPRQSEWGEDLSKKVQYRRINRYMSEMSIPIYVHPSLQESSQTTYSYHHPISSWAKWLQQNHFTISVLEEWCSPKRSEGSKRVMEDRARQEFPLFLYIQAIKQKSGR